jgi:hypothetical protein
MVFSGISGTASFSLLCFLGYQEIRAKFYSPAEARRSHHTPQGYFWLVQVFIAGMYSVFHNSALSMIQILFKVSRVYLLSGI